jgi:hypothetical protein
MPSGLEADLEIAISRCACKRGPKTDTRRAQLEHAVGQVSHRHGIAVRAQPGGVLAQTLAVVLDAVGEPVPDVDRLKQIAGRVSRDVNEEIKDLALFDTYKSKPVRTG